MARLIAVKLLARIPQEPTWLAEAVDIVVRQGVGLRQAAADMGQSISQDEVEDLFRRKAFQRLLWATRHRYHTEIAEDPERGKAAKIGQLEILAQKLEAQGDYDKSAEVILKIAKIEGWLTPDSTVNVFGSLSAKEFSELRRTLEKPTSVPPPPLEN